MRVKIFSKIAALCVGLILQTSAMAYHAENFTEAKRIARFIWSEHPETFYCGCDYDRHGKVNFKSCGYAPNNKRQSKRISWEHVMPVSWYGKSLSCWKKDQHASAREVCRRQDPRFRKMESELNNLVPAIREINLKRRNYGYGELPRAPSFGCHFYVSDTLQRVEPRDEVKGMAARIMLYMAKKYNVKVDSTERRLLIKWNRQFPPSVWEQRWHEQVSTIQGDVNPYIYYYKK